MNTRAKGTLAKAFSPSATIRTIGYALKGLWVVSAEPSFIRILVVGTLLEIGIWYFCRPLSSEEFRSMVLALAAPLVAELINTACEKFMDRFCPELDEEVGKSKDILAGATLVAVIAGLAVLCLIMLSR